MSIMDEIYKEDSNRNDIGKRFEKYVADLEKCFLENVDELLVYIYNKGKSTTTVGIKKDRGFFKPYEYLDVMDLKWIPRKEYEDEDYRSRALKVTYYTDGKRIWMEYPGDSDWRNQYPTLKNVKITHVTTSKSEYHRRERKFGVVDKTAFVKNEIGDLRVSYSSRDTVRKCLEKIKKGPLSECEAKALRDFLYTSPEEHLKKHIKDRLSVSYY